MQAIDQQQPKATATRGHQSRPDMDKPTSKGTTMTTKATARAKPAAKAKVSQAKPPRVATEVLMISLANIEVREQVRTLFDQEKLELMAQDIERRGLRQPIEVTPIGDEKYLLTTGERRFRAFKILQRAEIPALIVKTPEGDRLVDQLAENIQREELDLADEVKAVRQLVDALGSSKAVAEWLCKSKSWVSKRLALSYENLGWMAKRVIEEGLSEDIELINALSALEAINYGVAVNQVEALKRGTATRESVRQALADKKAELAQQERDRQQMKQLTAGANQEPAYDRKAETERLRKLREEGHGPEFLTWAWSRLAQFVQEPDTENPFEGSTWFRELTDKQRACLLAEVKKIEAAHEKYTFADLARDITDIGWTDYLPVMIQIQLMLRKQPVSDYFGEFLDILAGANAVEKS